MGNTAPALSLTGLGVGLAVLSVGGSMRTAMIAAMIKTFVAPAIAVPLIWWVGTDPSQAAVALIFAATPTAVASYVLTGQLGGDQRLAAAIVSVSTVLSMLSLTIALQWSAVA